MAIGSSPPLPPSPPDGDADDTDSNTKDNTNTNIMSQEDISTKDAPNAPTNVPPPPAPASASASPPRRKKKSSLYLYTGAAAHPVEEFQARDVVQAGSTPSFILDVTWPRVVQFYLPESGLCQEFKPRYIELAREFRRGSKREVVLFHAVSCAAYPQLCADYGVKGVPFVAVLRQGSTEAYVVERTRENRLAAARVAEALGIDLTDASSSSSSSLSSSSNENKKHSPSSLKHGHEAVFLDAAASLRRSFQSTVELREHRLSSSEQYYESNIDIDSDEALEEWLDLLHWALPSSLSELHNLVNDVRHSPKEDLLQIIDDHSSSSSQKGWVECGGYACGLWRLFHVLTIGAVEQHRSVIGEGTTSVSPRTAARAIEGFVHTVYGPYCHECREAYRSITKTTLREKLSDTPNANDEDEWKQWALQMWQTHNKINAIAATEKFRREGRLVTDADLSDAFWPSREECPDCWHRDGSYDETSVYGHLHKVYWPRGGGLPNPRLVVLGSGSDRRWRRRSRQGSGTFPMVLGVVLVLVLVLAMAAALAQVRMPTTPFGSTSRSRSRSRPQKRRPHKTKRSQPLTLTLTLTDVIQRVERAIDDIRQWYQRPWKFRRKHISRTMKYYEC